MATPTQTRHISWNAVANADSYEVFINGVSRGLVSGTTYDYPVPENTSWPVQVRGVNGAGLGPLSTSVNATTGNLAPPPVTGLDSDNIQNQSWTVSWDYTKPPDHSTFVVTCTSGSVSVNQAAQTATITGIADSTSATVTVKAQDTGGLQSSAVTKTVTTPAAPVVGAPGIPPALVLTRTGYSSADFDWGLSSGTVDTYQVASNGTNWSNCAHSFYSWTGLAESTRYTLYVRAVGPGGASPATTKSFTTLPKVKSKTPNYSTRNYGYGQTYPWNQTGINYYISGVNAGNNGWAASQWSTSLDSNTNTGPYNASAGAWVDFTFTLNFDSVPQVWALWGYPGTYEWDAWTVDGTLVQQGRTVIDATAGVWLTPNVRNAPVTDSRINRVRLYFYGGGVGSGVYKLREWGIQARVITSYTTVNNPA